MQCIDLLFYEKCAGPPCSSSRAPSPVGLFLFPKECSQYITQPGLSMAERPSDANHHVVERDSTRRLNLHPLGWWITEVSLLWFD
jgi:hypothetical protein